MKRLAAVCFTGHGAELLKQLDSRLEGWEIAPFTTAKLSRQAGLPAYEGSLSQWAGAHWDWDGLLFIGAAGIAVRAVAPFAASKKSDPAVVVLDEQGKFSISLLSGHLGGANRLAEQIAGAVGAMPVVTTATDRNGKFSVDAWAAEHRCVLKGWDAAKAMAAALVAGEQAGFVSRFPVEGIVPEELIPPPMPVGAVVTLHPQDRPFPKTVQLIPKIVTVGIGCRKNTPAVLIREQVLTALETAGISPDSVCQAATIDLKAQEPGLLEFCREQGWELICYTAGELMEAEGEFTPSAFVRQTTGVDNVCERAAVLASKGRLLLPKQAANGVTAAAAAEEYLVKF